MTGSTANVLVSSDKQTALIDGYLEEMSSLRKHMKESDKRIKRAERLIRVNLDEAWAIIRHVQASN